MAKSKYAPALFEVIDSGKESTAPGSKLAVPAWMKGDKPAQADEKSEPAQEAAVQEPVEETDQPASQSAPEATVEAPPIAIIDEARPMLRFRHGRLEISLNPVSSLVVAGVVVLLLVVSYQLGSMRGQQVTDMPQAGLASPGADSIEEALNQKPNANVLGGDPRNLIGSRNAKRDNGRHRTGSLIMPKGNGSDITAQTGKRIPGMIYVILESFKAEDYKQAEHAQTWLSDKKNVMTTLEKRGQRWALYSTDGFSEKKWATDYRNKVILMGKQYKSEFAGKVAYNFRDPQIITEKVKK
ncbi:MAG: hypothetical protein ACYTF1_22755 [Planctomycetota bacterium]|jgi:hypothetical protein